MSLLYARVHACVVCFRKGAGKTCPNFVLEGLACGRPIVLTAGVGLAGLIARRQAGIVVESSASALADGIARVQADWRRLSENARRLAVEEFDLRHFQARYDELYRAIAA
jgi:glycosyltransferase involved in cell wall biosynthesis